MTGVGERAPGAGVSIRRRRRVATLIARSDGLRLLRHPFVLLGAALVVPLTVGIDFFAWAAPVLHRDDALVAMICAPLAAGTLLAANLATTRSRRHDAVELFAPTPTPESSRTVGQLLSLLAPVALACLLSVAWLVWAAARPGAVGSPRPLQVLQGPALVFAAGAIGVMVGRWTPARVAPVLVLPILAFPLLLSDAEGWVRWLTWFRQPQSGTVPELSVEPVAAHLAWLVAIGLVACSVAMLRHGAGVRRLASLAGALAVLSAATFVQSQVPSSAAVSAAFELAQQPERLHVCRTEDQVTSCVWPAYAPLADRWHPLVAGAVAPLPPRLRPALRVEMRPQLQALSEIVSSIPDPAARARWRQRFARATGATAARELGDRAAIVARPGWPGPRMVEDTTFAWARAAAVRAVGFDPGPTLTERPASGDEVRYWREIGDWPGREDGRPMPEVGEPYPAVTSCSTAGRSRSVVALWLAAQATDRTEDHARSGADPAARLARWGSPDQLLSHWFEAFVGGGFVHGDQASRHWAIDDLELAVQLLDRDTERVASTLVSDWDRWTDPSTTSGELREAFRLRPPRTVDERLDAAGLTRADVPDHGRGGGSFGIDGLPACA